MGRQNSLAAKFVNCIFEYPGVHNPARKKLARKIVLGESIEH
jgi:hypothetical protein